MGNQSIKFLKFGLVIMAVFALGACGSSGDSSAPGGGGVAGNGSGAGAGSDGRGPRGPGGGVDDDVLSGADGRIITEEEALLETVFYFDFDVAQFRSADRQRLAVHARDLAANPSKRVRLEGHADERGTREYNLALGERRANGVLNYLIVNGATRAQIEVVSYGEEQPAAQGTSESAYARNRRVEIAEQ